MCIRDRAQTFGERQRRLVQHLAGSDIGARVLIIEALLTRQIVGRGSDRQVAGFLVPLGGVFRFEMCIRDSICTSLMVKQENAHE